MPRPEGDSAAKDGRNLRLPSIEEVLADPAASYWLKESLMSALSRDPVDAAHDAEILARLLQRRCRAILSHDRGGAG